MEVSFRSTGAARLFEGPPIPRRVDLSGFRLVRWAPWAALVALAAAVAWFGARDRVPVGWGLCLFLGLAPVIALAGWLLSGLLVGARVLRGVRAELAPYQALATGAGPRLDDGPRLTVTLGEQLTVEVDGRAASFPWGEVHQLEATDAVLLVARSRPVWIPHAAFADPTDRLAFVAALRSRAAPPPGPLA